MGCMKSKQTFPFPTTIERSEARVPSPVITQVITQEAEAAKEPAGPQVAVSEFAHRLSQEIVSGALQQWADRNSKYADIPFIESEGPDGPALTGGARFSA